MIRQIENEIKKFNEYLYVIQILKNPSFKRNHWMVFLYSFEPFLNRYTDLV